MVSFLFVYMQRCHFSLTKRCYAIRKKLIQLFKAQHMSEKQESYKGAGKLDSAVTDGFVAAILSPSIVKILPVNKTVRRAIVVGVTGLAAVVAWQQAADAEKQFNDTAKERDLYKNAVTNAVHQGLLKTEQTLSVSPA